LPIDPKPTMTIGPVMRACTGEAGDGIQYLRMM
jgi:hypothetical protein